GDGDWDQVGAARDAVGRVVVQPAGAGQVDLDPGVRGAGSRHVRRAAGVERGIVDVAGDETTGETDAAQGLDHQPGVVAARPRPRTQRLGRRLGAFGFARLVAEGRADGVEHAPYHVDGVMLLLGHEGLGP